MSITTLMLYTWLVLFVLDVQKTFPINDAKILSKLLHLIVTDAPMSMANSIRYHNKLARKAAGVLPPFTLDICRTDTTQVLARTRFVCMVSAELPPTIIMISPSSTT